MDDEQLAEWDAYLDAPSTETERVAEKARVKAVEDANQFVNDGEAVELDEDEIPEHILKWMEYMASREA